MPHTKNELLSWAKDAWEKIIRKHKEEEVTLKGYLVGEWYGNAKFGTEKPVKRGLEWRFETPCFWVEMPYHISKELKADFLDKDNPTPCEITIKIKKNHDNSINQKEVF